MRIIWLTLASAALAFPAAAHDFWLQPQSFWVAPKSVVSTSIQVGHASFRQRSPIAVERIITFRSIGPQGAIDRKPELLAREAGDRQPQPRFGRPPPPALPGDFTLAFPSPGTHVVALETNHAENNLPGLRFTDYLKAEGLTPVLQLRAASKTTDAPGKEIYSRRAKALIQVGPVGSTPQPQVTRPLGMTLEIVPERNPYTLGPDEKLPVRVIYEGRPLAGALVKLTNLEFDARPIETHLSDAAGRAAFTVPRTGTWLINVIWTKPIKGNPKADYDTTFSSLSFGFNRVRPPS